MSQKGRGLPELGLSSMLLTLRGIIVEKGLAAENAFNLFNDLTDKLFLVEHRQYEHSSISYINSAPPYIYMAF